jgi:GH25 family lysozyme M1 (1,4-beta-N-acetylmuramidase)
MAALAVACGTLAGSARGEPAPKGIDVSDWQGQIEWLRVGAAGYDFAYARATDGQTFVDTMYPLNRAGAASYGVRIGAYHFARPSGTSDAGAAASAIAQAEFFLSVAQPAEGDLLPVLDLERSGELPSGRLIEWTRVWLEYVGARLGVKPVIYSSGLFWKYKLADTPLFATAGHRFWIAHWTKATLPVLPGAGWGGQGWAFWQWTDCGRVSGVESCVDSDRFNGADLDAASMPAYPEGPPVPSSPPVIVGTPQSGQLLAAVPGSWSGGKPLTFAYRWLRCNARGAHCVPIPRAVGEAYWPGGADVGHALAVSVVAQSPGGAAAATSPPTLVVASAGAPSAFAPRAIAAPTLRGRNEVGQTITATHGRWKGRPKAFAYQWRRCTRGIGCVAISGAGSPRYTVAPGDIGSKLSLVVTATGRGGSRSATATSSTVSAPAPLPQPTPNSARVVAGRAGAVVLAGGAATVSWQPGAVPVGAAVSLGGATARLALPGTAVQLAIGTRSTLPWPVDVQYAAAPRRAEPAYFPGRGVWQPVGEVSAGSLPDGQTLGFYRDARRRLHVLTRVPGRIALFAPGAWGDPRRVAAGRPTLTFAATLAVRIGADGAVQITGRLTLDSQARLSLSVLGTRGKPLAIDESGDTVTVLRSERLRPGAFSVRIRIARGQPVANIYRLRVTAVDPYRRRSELLIPVEPAA